ncbi:MAG TPA: hypothetical protein P5108_03160 [Marmoricola sp.]|nr:hypothetical protein [Nocardioidaceae bacterium]MCO5324195.1 hypothetical protein [Nocardioidaceae bacterium]HRV68424.1 hypothetical protein [Marmoricola sp.]
MISRLSGHIGDKAAALVDGQLSPEASERAWSHVLGCPGCRQIVEYEAWTKRQLGALSTHPEARIPAPSEHLIDILQSVECAAPIFSSGDPARNPRRTVGVLGAGALSVVLAGGLLAGITQAGAPARDGITSSRTTASVSGGVIALLTGASPRIGDETELPEARSGRQQLSVSWRLPR